MKTVGIIGINGMVGQKLLAEFQKIKTHPFFHFSSALFNPLCLSPVGEAAREEKLHLHSVYAAYLI